MKLNKIYNEPCLETLKKMPNDFLDCVISSPPYWQLRDYGYDGQWGLEPTFNEYLEHLWEMMDEIYRVLKPSGTCWINLGDTYNSGGNTRSNKEGQTDIKLNGKPKCLLLIPHRFAIGCIDRGWIVRNDIIWAKRNCMPESIKDRFSKKHEYIFLMVKNEKYNFDLDAIRDKHIWENDKRNDGKRHQYKEGAKAYDDKKIGIKAVSFNPLGKNPGDVSDFWDIKTKPSSVKHYASYNDKLLEKPLLSGCPIGGIVYDPFMGTGSTAEVCLRTNRNYIGSEMSSKYCEIAEKRLQPYLQQTTMF